MPRWMMGIAVLGAAGLLASGHGRVAAGFALGALLGILGYFWLHPTVKAMLDANSVRLPRGIVVKLALRYVLVAAAVFFFYRTGWLPVLAIFGGLLVPGAGVLVESLILLREGFRS